MNWNTSSTDFGVSRTLSDLSNQNRLHGAHADISIGRSVPNASSISGAIGWRQFEQLGMRGFYGRAAPGREKLPLADPFSLLAPVIIKRRCRRTRNDACRKS